MVCISIAITQLIVTIHYRPLGAVFMHLVYEADDIQIHHRASVISFKVMLKMPLSKNTKILKNTRPTKTIFEKIKVDGTESGRSCMLGTGYFPDFAGKIRYPKNETGNADLYIPFLLTASLP